jgi:hypothetical protein
MFTQAANDDDRSRERQQADPGGRMQYIPEQDQQWQVEEIRRKRK